MSELLGPGGGACDASPKVSCEYQAGDLREEVGGGAPVGWGQGLQDEIPDTEKPKAGRRGCWEHQEACLAVLPDQDGALPIRAYLHWTKSRATEVLLAPVSEPDSGAPLQGVEGPAADPVGGGVEGD